MSRLTRGARFRQQADRYSGFIWTPDDPRYRKVYAILGSQTPGTLLDIGCGNGAFSEVLVRGGWKCSALELLPDLAKDALGRGLAVVAGDTSSPFPFASGAFDAAFAGEILEHQVGDDDFLAECERVLKPGGILILTTPNLVSLGNRIRMGFGMLPRFAYDEPHYRIYTLDLLLRKIRSAGMTPVHVSASHVLISRSSPHRLLAQRIGRLGEWLAARYPRFGEMFVVVCQK
jgi:SAM-dependent methyltransferase